MATFLHSGARGDIIYSLPTIRSLGGGVLYIKLDNRHYKSTPMTAGDIQQLGQLLRVAADDYITDVKVWSPDIKVDHNLDEFRNLSLTYEHLANAHLKTFGVRADLSLPWLSESKIQAIQTADIVINRSLRYHGPFDWQLLQDYQHRCAFAGFKEEYDAFVQITGLEQIRHVQPATYLELAGMIKGSKLFIGNQSFAYSLAEAMKHPRVQEVYLSAPNCLPCSNNGFTRLTRGLLGHFLENAALPNDRKLGIYQAGTNRCVLRTTGTAVRIPKVSCVIPIDGVNDPVELIRAIQMCGMEVILVGSMLHLLKMTRLSWVPIQSDIPHATVVTNEGTFEQLANAGAAAATGKIICIVESEHVNYRLISDVVNAVKGTVALVGTFMATVCYPHVTGPCIAVTRRAYESCGLFNPAMRSGWLNYIEMNFRYSRKRFGCGHVNWLVRNWSRWNEPEMHNSLYIEKVYGKKVL